MTSCVETVLSHVIEGSREVGMENNEEDISNHWITLMKRYCKLKEESLDRTLWTIRFVRGLLVRHASERMSLIN